MKALRDFNFGDKKIGKGTKFEENATQEQIDALQKYKFISSPKKKVKKVKDGNLSEDTK